MRRRVDVGRRGRAFELERVRVDVGATEVIRAAADAIVDVARPDARREVEGIAEQPSGGDRRRAHEIAVDIQHAGRPSGLDHRRVAGDRDRLGQRADLQIDVDAERDAGAHDDAFAAPRGKTGELGGHGIGAGRQIEQAVIAAGVADGRHRRQQRGTLRRHRHAGQHGALFVFDVAANAAVTSLRRGWESVSQDCQCQQCREDTEHQNLPKEAGDRGELRGSLRPVPLQVNGQNRTLIALGVTNGWD